MKFGVILTVSVPGGTDIEEYSISSLLPNIADEWKEDDIGDECIYSYVSETWEDGESRQWAACLSKDQFDCFVGAYALGGEDAPTGGASGMPSPDGAGWHSQSPAIAFESNCPYAIIDAYVTPYPETVRKEKPFDERDWERIREAVIRQYE